MYFIKSIIDILMVLLLLRLLIRPNEALFDPIYRLIYRITDPVLIPSSYITRSPFQRILLILLALVVLRGAVFVSITPMSFISGIGISVLNLFQLLFKAYMVMWFVSVLSQRGFGTSFNRMIERAFFPFYTVAGRLEIPRRFFFLFVFLSLLVIYVLISIMIRYIIIPRAIFSPFSALFGLGEGLMLILSLFPFPGFFSLVIVIGALLSWVSPDPYNPVVQAIYGISEPLLVPFRRLIPNIGGLDISPILALLCFQIVGGLGQRFIGNLMGLV